MRRAASGSSREATLRKAAEPGCVPPEPAGEVWGSPAAAGSGQTPTRQDLHGLPYLVTAPVDLPESFDFRLFVEPIGRDVIQVESPYQWPSLPLPGHIAARAPLVALALASVPPKQRTTGKGRKRKGIE